MNLCKTFQEFLNLCIELNASLRFSMVKITRGKIMYFNAALGTLSKSDMFSPQPQSTCDKS